MPVTSVTWQDIISTVNSERRVPNDNFFNLGGSTSLASPSEGTLVARRINQRIASSGTFEFMRERQNITLDSNGRYTIDDTTLPGFLEAVNVYMANGSDYVYLSRPGQWEVVGNVLQVYAGVTPSVGTTYTLEYLSRYLVRDGTTHARKRDFLAAADYWCVPEEFAEVMYSGMAYRLFRKEGRLEDGREAKSEFNAAMTNLALHAPEVYLARGPWNSFGADGSANV